MENPLEIGFSISIHTPTTHRLSTATPPRMSDATAPLPDANTRADPRTRQVEEFLYSKSNRYHTSLMRGRHPRSFPQQSDLWTFVRKSEQRKERLVSGSGLADVVHHASSELDPVDSRLRASVLNRLKSALALDSMSVMELRSLSDILNEILAIMPASAPCSTRSLSRSVYKRISGTVPINGPLRAELATFRRVLKSDAGSAAFHAAAVRRHNGENTLARELLVDGGDDSESPPGSMPSTPGRRKTKLPFGVTSKELKAVMRGAKVASRAAGGTADRVTAQLKLLSRKQALLDTEADHARTERMRAAKALLGKGRGPRGSSREANRRGSARFGGRVGRRGSNMGLSFPAAGGARAISSRTRRGSSVPMTPQQLPGAAQFSVAEVAMQAAQKRATELEGGVGSDADVSDVAFAAMEALLPNTGANRRGSFVGNSKLLERSAAALGSAVNLLNNALRKAPEEEVINAYTDPVVEDDPTVNVYYGSIVGLERQQGDSKWLSLVNHAYWKRMQGFSNVQSHTAKKSLRAHAPSHSKAPQDGGGRRRNSTNADIAAAPTFKAIDPNADVQSEGDNSIPWAEGGCLLSSWGVEKSSQSDKERRARDERMTGKVQLARPDETIQMFKIVNLNDESDTGLVHFNDDIWLVPALPHMSWMLTEETLSADHGADGWGCVLGAHIMQGAVVNSVATAEETKSRPASPALSPTSLSPTRGAAHKDSGAGGGGGGAAAPDAKTKAKTSGVAAKRATSQTKMGEARAFIAYIPTTLKAEEYVNDGNGPLRKKRMSRMASTINARAMRIGRWRFRSAAETEAHDDFAGTEVHNMAKIVLEHGWMRLYADHDEVVVRQPDDEHDSAARANQGVWTLRVIRTGGRGTKGGSRLQRENVLNSARDKMRESAALRAGSTKHMVVQTARGTEVELNSGAHFAVNMRMLRQETVIQRDGPMLKTESSTLAALALHLGDVKKSQSARFRKAAAAADERRNRAREKSLKRHGTEAPTFGRLIRPKHQQRVVAPVGRGEGGYSPLRRVANQSFVPLGSMPMVAPTPPLVVDGPTKSSLDSFEWLTAEEKPENSLCRMLYVLLSCAGAGRARTRSHCVLTSCTSPPPPLPLSLFRYDLHGLDQSVVGQINEEEAEAAKEMQQHQITAANFAPTTADEDEEDMFRQEIAIRSMSGTDDWVASSIQSRTQSKQFADFYRLLSSSFAETDVG